MLIMQADEQASLSLSLSHLEPSCSADTIACKQSWKKHRVDFLAAHCSQGIADVSDQVWRCAVDETSEDLQV